MTDNPAGDALMVALENLEEKLRVLEEGFPEFVEQLNMVLTLITSARNALHVYNRPARNLPNRIRIECRNTLDQAIAILQDALK